MGLPADPVSLLSLADALVLQPRHSIASLERARASLSKALPNHKKPFEVHWRIARVCQLMAAAIEDPRRHVALAEEGRRHAERATALAPGRVEGHYYLALNTGRLAEAGRRLSLIKPMVAAANRARTINAAYAGAGALIFLGKVYLTAPAWPVSVGDTEKALELLKEAVRLAPDNAMARLFLAQALAAEEEFADAKVQLDRVQAMPLRPRWRKEARKVLEQVNKALGPASAAATSPTKGQ